MKALADPFEQARLLLERTGRWMIAGVETAVFWPERSQVIEFYGMQFVLRPPESSQPNRPASLPSIVLKADAYGLDDADARKAILQFASALAWHTARGIEVITWLAGSRPFHTGRMQGGAITEYLDAEHIAAADSDDLRAALALYREGISLDNPFYAFLSLYKAFSIAISDKKGRGAWINQRLSVLRGSRATERLAELRSAGVDVSAYLYTQCRHAIAHADEEPYVNPDRTDDSYRLMQDVPLMRGLAEIAIEEKFGFPRLDTILGEHLYELSGFKHVLHPDIVGRLKRGEILDEEERITLPSNTFLLVARRNAEAHWLRDMRLTDGGSTEGTLILELTSALGTVAVQLALDFQQERLIFDPISQFRVSSSRESHGVIQEELDAAIFQSIIARNGRLEVWDETGEERLGCSDAFIPVNMFVDFEFFEKRIEELKNLLTAA